MKPLLTTLAFLGLAAAAIIIVASCTTQGVPPNQTVEMILGDPNSNPPRYVDLKPGSEGRLRVALARLKSHGGVCELTYLENAAAVPIPNYCDKIDVRLKTERVIRSAGAKHVGAVSGVANDPNLMYRMASPNPSDISDVASLLK